MRLRVTFVSHHVVAAFESDVLSQHPLTSAEALQQQVEQFLRDDAHAFFQFLLVSPKAENVWESSLLEDADWEERDEALLLMWDALDPMDRQSWINEATYIREYRAARIEEVRSNTQRRTVKFARPAADWNPPAPTLGICVDAGHDAFDWMDEEDSLERRVEDNLKAMLGDVESMDLPRTRGIKRGRAQDDVSGLECLGPADAGLDSKRRQISHLRTWTRCAPGSA